MILKADTLSMETTLGAKMLVAVLLALFWVWVMKKVIAKAIQVYTNTMNALDRLTSASAAEIAEIQKLTGIIADLRTTASALTQQVADLTAKLGADDSAALNTLAGNLEASVTAAEAAINPSAPVAATSPSTATAATTDGAAAS